MQSNRIRPISQGRGDVVGVLDVTVCFGTEHNDASSQYTQDFFTYSFHKI